MYANIYISNGMLISIYHNLKAYFVSLGERFIKTKFAYPFIFLMGLIEAIIFPFPLVTSSSSALDAHTKNDTKKMKITYKIMSGLGVDKIFFRLCNII